MWNVNDTSVDLFLKRSALDGADRALNAANVSYSILIADLQSEIEAENPPKDQIEQLQNRKGMSLTIHVQYTHTRYDRHRVYRPYTIDKTITNEH